MNEQGTEITRLSKCTTKDVPLESAAPRQFVAKNWSHLVSERVSVDFEFTIHNFDFWKYHGSSIEYSSKTTFSAQEIPDSHWMLDVIKGSDEGLLIKLHLYKESGKREVEQRLPSQVHIELAILNNKREKKFPRQYFFPILAHTPLMISYFNLEVCGDEVNDLLPNGNLSVYCQIQSLTERKIVSGSSGKIPVNNQSSGRDLLIGNLEDLFQTKKLSDVIFVVRGFTFKSHKCILAARSPVFAATFEHETTEKLTDKVEVQDIEPEVFQEVLRFIYTGRVCPAQMKEFGPKLLAAADKYLLENLKQLCEEHLVNHLTAENCLEMLIFTDLHTLNYLRQNALNFLRRHLSEVRKTDSWKEMKQNSPRMLCEIQELIMDLPTVLRVHR